MAGVFIFDSICKRPREKKFQIFAPEFFCTGGRGVRPPPFGLRGEGGAFHPPPHLIPWTSPSQARHPPLASTSPGPRSPLPLVQSNRSRTGPRPRSAPPRHVWPGGRCFFVPDMVFSPVSKVGGQSAAWSWNQGGGGHRVMGVPQCPHCAASQGCNPCFSFKRWSVLVL